jgi:hypothetical protein
LLSRRARPREGAVQVDLGGAGPDLPGALRLLDGLGKKQQEQKLLNKKERRCKENSFFPSHFSNNEAHSFDRWFFPLQGVVKKDHHNKTHNVVFPLYANNNNRRLK